MKRSNFLLVAIALVLTITAVSCTTLTGTQDDYYNGQEARVYGNRVYVDDPYRGTVVLERDPYTGRYYEVNPYGSYGNRNYRVYNSNGGYYGRNNGYRNNNRYNGNRGSYQNQNSQKPQISEERRRE